LKLIFAGTPEFAAQALSALIAQGHEIALVLSRTDKPSGRGQQLTASPVKQVALQAGIPVLQPRTLKPGLRDEEHLRQLRHVGADAMIVAAYGLILPPDVLTIPRLGCLNIHASLLPRWRGAAPIQRAIEAGDAQTGITIMQMDEGLDTGAMRLVRPLEITLADTASSLHDKLAVTGAEAIVEALKQLDAGTLPSTPQPAEGVCMAAKIEKSESQLAWSMPASALACKIRALDPFPGCVSSMKGTLLKIWSAQALNERAMPPSAAEAMSHAQPGQVVSIDAEGLTVCTGQGLIQIRALQKPGGKRLPARDFLAGWPVAVGERFE
jgi:methionyl-tRNA formyltransferase